MAERAGLHAIPQGGELRNAASHERERQTGREVRPADRDLSDEAQTKGAFRSARRSVRDAQPAPHVGSLIGEPQGTAPWTPSFRR